KRKVLRRKCKAEGDRGLKKIVRLNHRRRFGAGGCGPRRRAWNLLGALCRCQGNGERKHRQVTGRGYANRCETRSTSGAISLRPGARAQWSDAWHVSRNRRRINC